MLFNDIDTITSNTYSSLQKEIKKKKWLAQMATNCLNHKWQCKTKWQWTPEFYQILIDPTNGKVLHLIDQQSETSFLFLRTDQGYRNNFLKRYYYCKVIYFSNKHAYRCLTIWIVFIINGSSSKLTNHCNRCFYIRERERGDN